MDTGREGELRSLLERRILILDGAMGTMLQREGLKAADFGGPELEGCNENLVLTRPDAVSKVHAAYLEAGADIVETCSFGAVPLVLSEYGLEAKAEEINRRAARLARDEARRFSTKDKPRFAAGSMGPGTKSILVTGGISFDEVRAAHAGQARALMEGGCDLLLLETQQDTLNLKASLLGVRDAFDALGRRVPVVVSVSIEGSGTMLAGQGIEALYASVEHASPLAVGLNCATGPDFMADHLRSLASLSRFAVACYPNAGLPDEEGRYSDGPEAFAAKLSRFAREGWINIAGGCCGTTPDHIRAAAAVLAAIPPRKARARRLSLLAGMELLSVDPEKRPILVGERTNVIGSRLFKEMIAQGRFEEGSEVARRQVRGGAQVVDVCLANPDRDEKADMRSFLPFLVRKVKAPWMIDSTDPAVVEEALKLCPGKAVINSVNLEEGEKRLQRTVPLARGFGAALVVGAIDEDKASGMAVTRERKLAIVRRSHALLTEKYGMPEEDLYFDPLVFPCASGDKAYAGSALETIEGLRLIKKEFPRCPTLLGISNVSFGLPPAGREALNSVFLRHCVEAGLDFAIVNSEKLARFAALPAAERELCERVLFKGTPEAVAEFAAAYRQAKPPATDSRVGLPAAERARLCVVEGSKEGLREALDELSASRPPLEIVNGPLMEGMDEVGRLFGENRLIVAEVLQSAEVMQEAVSILEPRMGKGSAAPRGRVLLATVKGDVHDIGKNLVHIILKNNGYAVSDAGIKVSPEALIAKAREFRPDIIGLSGLLVKSTQQMAATAADMREAGIRAPLLVGGAALTERFAASRIAPAYGGPVLYAKDAMTGLSLANRLSDPARREALLSENRSRQAGLAGPAVGGIPAPPDFKVHAMADIDPKEVFGRLDMARLCGRHLGVGEAGGSKGAEIRGRIESLMAEAAAAGWVKPKAVYRFVQARSSRGGLLLFDGDRALEAFSFPRLANGACLADLVSGDGKDNMALFALTCGEGVAELSDRFRESGEYLKSHALRALAVEAAEALAEMVHARLRFLWGIPASQGARASIGYPACPAIEDQAKVFRLLDPEKSIGLRLGESFVMDPEASVTALVFH